MASIIEFARSSTLVNSNTQICAIDQQETVLTVLTPMG